MLHTELELTNAPFSMLMVLVGEIAVRCGVSIDDVLGVTPKQYKALSVEDRRQMFIEAILEDQEPKGGS